MSPKKCLVKCELYRTALNQTERYQGQREVKLNAVWDSAELQNVGDLIKWWIKNRNETLIINFIDTASALSWRAGVQTTSVVSIQHMITYKGTAYEKKGLPIYV